MKKSYLILAAVTVVVAALAGCKVDQTPDNMENNKEESTEMETAGVTLLTAEEAYQRMESKDPLTIVDVRTKEEYDAGHIEGAVLIPNEEIGEQMPAILPLKDAEILVYCRSGNRSAQAAEKLSKMGYTKVNDFGGIKDWTYETVSTPWEAKEGSYQSFRTTDIYGNTVDETVFADAELTMVNVWATFCGPCLKEMPELGELSAEYADKNVQIVGIVLDTVDSSGKISQNMVETARDIAVKTGAGYQHLLPSEDILNAGVSEIYSVPTTFFVDKEGKLVGKSHLGSRSKADWIKIIDETMGQMGM